MEVDAAGGAGSAPSGDASGGSSKAAATAAAGSHGIDEAALYDRQLRVWGHEAQRRMRDSRVLVAGVTATLAEVRGAAHDCRDRRLTRAADDLPSETPCVCCTSQMAKNLVLGGIPVTLQDVVDVAAEDVGANILLAATDAGSNVRRRRARPPARSRRARRAAAVRRSRAPVALDARVGSCTAQRAQAALPRLQELNGFLEVDAVTTPLLELADDAWSRFSVVVASAAQLAPEEQFALDERCRAKGVGLYIVDTFGLHATFFVDLQEHTWIE